MTAEELIEALRLLPPDTHIGLSVREWDMGADLREVESLGPPAEYHLYPSGGFEVCEKRIRKRKCVWCESKRPLVQVVEIQGRP